MPVLLFSLGVAAITALIFGLVPALQTARRQLTPGLRDGGKGTGGGFRRARLSSGLVVVQIALALVLLNSAGLLMRTFIKMQGTSLGLDPERVLFVRVPNGTSLETADAQQQFLAQALTRIRALPGVEAASSTTGFPPFGGYPADFEVVGASQGQQRRAMVEQISDGYLTTLTMRLRRGRDFTADDVGGRRRVAIVNERLVEMHLKGEADPIGRRLSLALPGGEGQSAPEVFEIVGVVADVKNQGITSPIEPEIFVPASMAPSRNSQGLLVKTAGRAAGDGPEREERDLGREPRRRHLGHRVDRQHRAALPVRRAAARALRLRRLRVDRAAADDPRRLEPDRLHGGAADARDRDPARHRREPRGRVPADVRPRACAGSRSASPSASPAACRRRACSPSSSGKSARRTR